MEIQKDIADRLNIRKHQNLVENLRKEVLEQTYFVIYSIEDDNPSETLIGECTIKDNPLAH